MNALLCYDRKLLDANPSTYCEQRKHQIFESPVGSVRIATIELLVAFIDKIRDARVEGCIPGLIEDVMVFFCNHTSNDFIGIEMVQLVRRVLASGIQSRIHEGLLTNRVLDGLKSALNRIGSIWELGHLRCIVKDILAKHADKSSQVRATLERYAAWTQLRSLMEQTKEGTLKPDPKLRCAADGSTLDIRLPVGPLSPLAAGALRKTLHNGEVVHEDTPRKVVYVASADVNRKAPTPTLAAKADDVAMMADAKISDDETVRSLF
eukprot:SAG31_NODE_5769_length_2335_cov_1.097496_3_plen_264_part_00